MGARRQPGWLQVTRYTMTEQACTARRESPYLFDWTDEADEWHEKGEVRPIFGMVTQTCLRADGHADKHEWPKAVIPAPRRQLKAIYFDLGFGISAVVSSGGASVVSIRGDPSHSRNQSIRSQRSTSVTLKPPSFFARMTRRPVVSSAANSTGNPSLCSLTLWSVIGRGRISLLCPS